MGCTNFDPNNRFTLRAIDEVLDGRCDVYKTCEVLKLNVTQSTAIEQADHHIAKLMENHMQSPVPVSVPNEGTNACAFLAVKIGDRIIHELNGNVSDTVSLAEMIEEVIWCLPEKINVNRDVTKLYDVLGAYSILSEVKVLNSRYEFFEELPFADCIYTFESRKRLHEKLCILGENDFAAIFSSEPYILVIGCARGKPFVIDTHTASLMVGRDNGRSTWRSLCVWLWDRLLSAGVKEGTGQSLSVMKPIKG